MKLLKRADKKDWGFYHYYPGLAFRGSNYLYVYIYNETFHSFPIAENESAFFNDLYTFPIKVVAKMRHLNIVRLEWFCMYLNEQSGKKVNL